MKPPVRSHRAHLRVGKRLPRLKLRGVKVGRAAVRLVRQKNFRPKQ